MVGLTDLEVYNSLFNITEENNKFKLFNFLDEIAGSISYTKVRNEIEKGLVISNNTATDLQDDLIGRSIIKGIREQVAKRVKDDNYMYVLSGYSSSLFQDFESFLTTEVDLVEDDIKSVLEEYNSSFITFEIPPGFYIFKDISDTLLNFLQSEYKGDFNLIVFEYDDITMKTKLVVRPGIIAMRFDGKSFFNTILGFTSGWDYKHNNEYNSQKFVNLKSTNKVHLKCDVIDGSVVNGLRQPILFSFVLDKTIRIKIILCI